MLKLIFSLVALIAAFIFALVIPGSGLEEQIIAVITGLAGALGITNWRLNFDVAKQWFSSKTILGSLLVVIPIIAIIALPLLGVILPAWLALVLNVLIVGGGGTTLWGIFDVIEKNSNRKLSGEKANKSLN